MEILVGFLLNRKLHLQNCHFMDTYVACLIPAFEENIPTQKSPIRRFMSGTSCGEAYGRLLVLKNM
jgi:hypothetical protein